MYSKNHKKWLPVKENLDLEKSQVKHYYRNGEIRWAALGVNIGNEIDGKGDQFLRPVLILEKLSPGLYFVLPLSTKLKDISCYIQIETPGQKVSICLNQAKTLSEKRIFGRISKVGKIKFDFIKESFRKYIKI